MDKDAGRQVKRDFIEDVDVEGSGGWVGTGRQLNGGGRLRAEGMVKLCDQMADI